MTATECTDAIACDAPGFLTLPGVKCWCGNPEIVSVQPGDDGERSIAIGVLTSRPAPLRGFCCLAHATGPSTVKGAKSTSTAVFNGQQWRDGIHARFAFRASGHAADRRRVMVPPAEVVAGLRTMFPSMVKHPDQVGQVLISGDNNSKIGGVVAKGPWRGLPVFTLTLEERATCPTSCHLLWECYGSGLPFSRRHEHGPALEAAIIREVAKQLAKRPNGIVVRLHVLGDFYSADYASFWIGLIRQHRRLRVFGYTAHPADSEIGRLIMDANREFPLRWIIRNSVRRDVPAAPYQATTVWKGETSDGIVCPAETGKTACCSTCALCWSDAMFEKRIVFLGHGREMVRQGKSK